jgi:hypothetical protein
MTRYPEIIFLAIFGLAGFAAPKPYTLGKVFQSVPPPSVDKAQVVFYHMPIEGAP